MNFNVMKMFWMAVIPRNYVNINYLFNFRKIIDMIKYWKCLSENSASGISNFHKFIQNSFKKFSVKLKIFFNLIIEFLFFLMTHFFFLSTFYFWWCIKALRIILFLFYWFNDAFYISMVNSSFIEVNHPIKFLLVHERRIKSFTSPV